MPITSSVVTVGTTPTLLAGEFRGRRRIIIDNESGSDVHVGGFDVTVTAGIHLENKESIQIVQQFANDKSAAQAFYGVVAQGTQNVSVTLFTEDTDD